MTLRNLWNPLSILQTLRNLEFCLQIHSLISARSTKTKTMTVIVPKICRLGKSNFINVDFVTDQIAQLTSIQHFKVNRIVHEPAYCRLFLQKGAVCFSLPFIQLYFNNYFIYLTYRSMIIVLKSRQK